VSQSISKLQDSGEISELELQKSFKFSAFDNEKSEKRPWKKNNLSPGEVTRHKETELLEQVLNNARVAIIVSDNNRKIERINPEFTRIFGYTAEEATGEYFHNLNLQRKEVNVNQIIQHRCQKDVYWISSGFHHIMYYFIRKERGR